MEFCHPFQWGNHAPSSVLVGWILLSLWSLYREGIQSLCANLFQKMAEESSKRTGHIRIKKEWNWDLALSDQPGYVYNNQQDVWEHIITPGKELSKSIILPIQSFTVSEAQDKVRKIWFRQQVYYLSSSQSNQETALKCRSAILLH